MNKTELVELVADKTELDKRAAASAVDAVIDSVMRAVGAGDKVSIVGFGSFNPTSRAARTGRNPQTGLPVSIGPSNGVRFAAGAAFKTLLNSKGAASMAASATQAPATKTAMAND